jgi:carbon-monoxide dehydrogenase medium subunit
VKPPPFEYVAASSAADAVEALRRHGDDAKVLAGGQSLIPMLALRLARPAALVDINGCGDLDGLAESRGVLTVNALVRQRVLERWARERVPLLAEALRWVAHPPIRNRGTVVGSVVHADPASELPALLLCLDGEVVARRRGGERVISAGHLYLAPLTTSLESDELATAVRFTLPPAGSGWGFAEVTRRHGDFALVGCAAVLALDDSGAVSHARLGFFGVGGTAVRSGPGEAALLGQKATAARIGEAAKAGAAALRPDGDLHATAEYRSSVAATLADRVLTAALERCRETA